jgi:hypothetical protein
MALQTELSRLLMGVKNSIQARRHAIASPSLRRYLAVVPPLAIRRYYGEVTAK